jgi:heme-degrading monooxygenase HmoA
MQMAAVRGQAGSARRLSSICRISYLQLTHQSRKPNHKPGNQGRWGRHFGTRHRGGQALSCMLFVRLHQIRKTMLKHIVMWKLKEHAEGADRAANAREMKRRLDECANIVPGILKFEVTLAQPGLEATYDVVLYSEFEDKAALEAYAKHPTHQALVPFIGAIREGRQCMDYEV